MECIEILHVAWKTVEFFHKIPVKFCKNFQNAFKMTCMENYVKSYKKCLATCKILQNVYAS